MDCSWQKAKERANDATAVHALFAKTLKQQAAREKKLGSQATSATEVAG